MGSATRHGLRAEQVREIRAAVARGEQPPTAESLGVQPSDLALVLEPPEQFTEIRDHGACDLAMPELAMALTELAPADRKIVDMLSEGMTVTQIARALQKTLSQVQEAVSRIRDTLAT